MEEYYFLKDYEKLCKKYKMGLQGCGCCGSPFLYDIHNINYYEKVDKILVDGYSIDEYFKKKGE